MKNISYLAISILFIGTVSCKKYRTCECTYTDSIGGVVSDSFTYSEISPIKMSNNNATDWCTVENDSYTYEDYDDNGNIITITSKNECELIK